MDVLKRKCSEQELEIARIQEDCMQKEAHISQLMQSSQVSVSEVVTDHGDTKKAQRLKIRELEVVVEQYKQDFQLARDRQIAHDHAAKKAISQLQQEMILRIDQVKKLYEEAVKDKENMVIRYAKSEKEVLEQKKVREALEHRLREVTQQSETLHVQIKQLRKELSKLKNSTEVKENESSSRQKEMDQLKEEISSQAIKVKWAQNKLKTELDAHKETKVILTKTEQRLKEAKEETEQIRKNCQEMIKTYQESEEIKSNSLDHKLKEKQVELTQHLQEKSDQMELHSAKLRELETLKKRYHDNMAELDSLQVKTKCLEDERLQNEELLSKFKELLNSQKEENRRLTKQVDELKALQHKLQDAKEEVKKMETNMSGQKEEYSELETELQSHRQKQIELLQFTEKITAKNTQMNSDNSALSDKVDALSANLKKLKEQMEELQKQHSQVTMELKQEKQYRERESTMLTSKLTEKAKAVEQLSIQLEDARDEMKTLRRKHTANIKDLTRQLQQAQKRLDADSKDGSPKDNGSLGSRTSSCGSLDTLPTANSSSSSHGVGSMSHSNSSSHINSAVNNSRFEDHHPPQDQHSVAIASNDYPGIDKNMLVERIVKLQRAQQRKNEKIEFMQEHVNSLVEEIKKKSKIIHSYILRDEAGALAPAASDANKAQMSKQTGIMSSLYSSKATDKTMTLDLSLEINRKLQAVLEDTLLKNITLKENIETLGSEIAHLTHKLSAVQHKEQRPKRK
ncbi:coiled-coil domain-containing protein 186-like isoform X2 [Amphiura filiformis]|uniref:coiled-coil domain-containing protein 186-like isoform X2 n=1 Tax=Amphiura filiformis TaxID=82378 RepID=UPI003B227A69